MPHKRSEDGKRRQSEAKKQRVRKQRIAIPQTEIDKARYCPPSREKYVTFPYLSQNLHDGVLVRLLKQVVSKDVISELQLSTTELMQNFQPPVDETCRGKQTCYYFGYWRESSFNVTKTPHTKTPAAQKWISHNQPLFTYVSALLKEYYPHMYDEYQKLDSDYRLFGCWSLAILNIDCLSTNHIDTKDWRNGFCAVLTFGDEDFVGRELHFPFLNATLDIRPQDVAFFQSHLLLHGNNQDIVGTRHSLVLVSHNTLFNMK